MKDKRTIFDFLGQTFCIFGISITILNTLCFIFGESAKGYSGMFALGGNGLMVKTIFQFLLVSILITGVRYLYLTDKIIKKASTIIRIALMLLSIIIIMAFFIFICGWFPVNMWQPWLMFFICFGVSFGISMLVTFLKEKVDNKNMEEALIRFKKEMK